MAAMNFHFPDDFLGEILKFLPVKTLCQFKCVSKSWRSVIQSSEFVKSHLQIHRHRSDGEHIFMPSHHCSAYHDPYFYILNTPSLLEGENPKAKKVEIPVGRRCIVLDTVACAYNGLLFIALDDESVLFVWNPSTGKLRRIPSLRPDSDQLGTSGRHLLYGFGYDSVNDDYKILRVCYESDKGSFESWLFSLTENTWRRINDRVLSGYRTCNVDQVLNDPYDNSCRRSVVVCVAGIAHFIVQKQEINNGGEEPIDGDKCVILSFSLAEERFVELLLPSCDVVGAVPILKLLAGRLSVQWMMRMESENSSDFVVWSLMDDENSSCWTKIISIPHSEMPQAGGLESICLMRNGYFVLRTSHERELFVYDMEKKVFRQVFKDESLDGNICSFKNTVVYTESLVQPCDYGDNVEEWIPIPIFLNPIHPSLKANLEVF